MFLSWCSSFSAEHQILLEVKMPESECWAQASGWCWLSWRTPICVCVIESPWLFPASFDICMNEVRRILGHSARSGRYDSTAINIFPLSSAKMLQLAVGTQIGNLLSVSSYMTLDHKTSLKLLGYICCNSQKYPIFLSTNSRFFFYAKNH